MPIQVVTPIQGIYNPGTIGLLLPDVEHKIIDMEPGTKDIGLNETSEILNPGWPSLLSLNNFRPHSLPKIELQRLSEKTTKIAS